MIKSNMANVISSKNIVIMSAVSNYWPW